MEEMMGKVKVYYFSPTGGTLQVAQRLGDRLGALLGAAVEYHSYTLPHEREALPQVEEAVVSHETGTAVVTLNTDVANEVLKNAVEAQDYQVTAIA